jgi:hypothetical protein
VRDPQDPTSGERSPGERPDDREPESAAGLGPRVSAVFTAAEQAAEHIIQMARAEVEDIRRAAESEVAAFRAQRRQDAEREARMLVEEARAEAEARRREQWIDEGIRLMVERAEWGRRGLQEVLARLEEFAIRIPTEWPEVGPPPPPLEREPDLPAARMAGPAEPPPAPEPAPEPEPEAVAPAPEPPVPEPEPEPEVAAPEPEATAEPEEQEPEAAEQPDEATGENVMPVSERDEERAEKT